MPGAVPRGGSWRRGGPSPNLEMPTLLGGPPGLKGNGSPFVSLTSTHQTAQPLEDYRGPQRTSKRHRAKSICLTAPAPPLGPRNLLPATRAWQPASRPKKAPPSSPFAIFELTPRVRASLAERGAHPGRRGGPTTSPGGKGAAGTNEALPPTPQVGNQTPREQARMRTAQSPPPAQAFPLLVSRCFFPTVFACRVLGLRNREIEIKG